MLKTNMQEAKQHLQLLMSLKAVNLELKKDTAF